MEHNHANYIRVAHLVKLYLKSVHGNEVTRNEFTILSLLQLAHGDWTISGIATATAIDRRTVRSTTKDLETQGLVKPSKELTPQGRKQIHRIQLSIFDALTGQEKGKIISLFPSQKPSIKMYRDIRLLMLDIDFSIRASQVHPSQTSISIALMCNPEMSTPSLARSTGYSYQMCYKTVSEMLGRKLATRTIGKKIALTDAGHEDLANKLTLIERSIPERVLRRLDAVDFSTMSHPKY